MSRYTLLIGDEDNPDRPKQDVFVLHDEPGPERDYGVRELYISEVRRQALFALRALADMRTAADSTEPSYDLDVWYHAQAFLAAAARVSRLLQPGRVGEPRGSPAWEAASKKQRQKLWQQAIARAASRGAMLRETLGVTKDSALLSRTVRDAYDHFDERLDSAAEVGAAPVIVDADVVRHSPMVVFFADSERQNMSVPLRFLDAQSGVLSFRWDVIHLPAVEEALLRLVSTAEEVLGTPGPRAKTAVGLFMSFALRLEARRREDGRWMHAWQGLSNFKDVYIDANSPEAPHLEQRPDHWPQRRQWEQALPTIEGTDAP